MSRKALEPPRLLLAAASLTHGARMPRPRMIEIAERYREPESLAVTLSKALDAGAEGVLAVPAPALDAALVELGRRVPIYAVLPDPTPSGRYDLQPTRLDPLEGTPGAAGFGTRLRLAWTRATRPWAFARRDFGLLVRLALEARASIIPRRALHGVVVAAGVTDLALAGGQRHFFEKLTRWIRGRFRARAAFETMNLGLQLARLREWDVRPDFVVGPVNPRGLMMKPSRDETLDEISRSAVPVVATQLRARGLCTLDEGARFAFEHGVLGLAPDLAEMDDVGAELARIRGWRDSKVPPRLEGERRA